MESVTTWDDWLNWLLPRPVAPRKPNWVDRLAAEVRSLYTDDYLQAGAPLSVTSVLGKANGEVSHS